VKAQASCKARYQYATNGFSNYTNGISRIQLSKLGGWVKITTLKSQVLGANFSQLKKLGLKTPFGHTAAASNQPYSARSPKPSSQTTQLVKNCL